MITFPVKFQEAYSPFWKPDNVCELRTALLLAFKMETVSTLLPESQSSRYRETRCVFPSVRSTLMLKVLEA